MASRLLRVLSLAAWPCVVPAVSAAAALVLRPEAVVVSHEVRLADVVDLGENMPKLRRQLDQYIVAPAPMPGQTLELRRGEVQRALATAGVAATLNGAALVKVRRQAQQVTAQALCEAAQRAERALAATLVAGAEFEARCLEGLPPVEVGSGPLNLDPKLVPADVLDGRHQVPIALVVGGRLERLVRVPVEVRLEAAQWCADDAVPAGELISARHFRACRRPVLRPEQLRLTEKALPGGRLRHALFAGDLLSATNVADGDVQLRGDAVTVVYQAGALAVESRGELSQDAHIGDEVRVQLRPGESVRGRLAAARRVEVEEAR